MKEPLLGNSHHSGWAIALLCRCCLCALPFVVAALAARMVNAGPLELKRHASAIERNLHEAVVAFWLPRSIDREHGGYHINFDIHGKPNGKTSKGLVTQARMV